MSHNVIVVLITKEGKKRIYNSVECQTFIVDCFTRLPDNSYVAWIRDYSLFNFDPIKYTIKSLFPKEYEIIYEDD